MSPTTLSRRTALQRGAAALAGAAAGCGPLLANAQAPLAALPETVRLIVGLPPGSIADLMARALGRPLTGVLARRVVVESHPGAGGRLAVDVLLQGGDDGHALMVTPSGVVTLVGHTFRKLSYRPLDDLAPLTTLSYAPFMFAIGPQVDAGVRTMADFAAWCAAQPGKAAFATLAAGSPPHFVGELLKQQFRFGAVHVPSRSSPLPEVLGGQIAATILSPSTLLPFAQDARLRILGTTGAKRFGLMPDVPTFAEQRASGLDWLDWYALYGSARAPAETLQRHAALVRRAMADAEVAQAWRRATLVDPAPSSAADLDRLARADSARWAATVQSTGFVAE